MKEHPNSIAIKYFNSGNYAKAEKFFLLAIKEWPSSENYSNMGYCLFNQNKSDEALKYFTKAVKINPKDLTSLENLFTAYFKLDKFDDALLIVDQIYSINGDIKKYFDIAVKYISNKEFDKGIQVYHKILKIKPSEYMIYNYIGSAYIDQNNSLKAKEYYLKSYQMNKNCINTLNNLSMLEHGFYNIEKAKEYANQSISLGSGDAYYIMGCLYEEDKNLDKCIENYTKALASDNLTSKEAVSSNIAMCLLAKGDLENGFKYYESRKYFEEYKKWPGTEWNGEPNRTVLLIPEQGFGDALHFCRYIKLVKQISKKTILLAHTPLYEIMKTLDGVDEVIEAVDGFGTPQYNNYVYLMSLPRIFKTTLETVPNEIPYLHPNKDKVEYWKSRIEQYNGFKVGLVWCGNPRHQMKQVVLTDAKRSMKLSQYNPLLDIPGITFFSLQKDDELNQIEQYPQIVNFMPEVHSYMDTACIVENLDLVISVDTSVVHLVGAINKPVWMLSRYAGCWRWLVNKTDTPWYPTMRIFNQPSPNDWDSVINEVKESLVKLLQ